MSTFIILKSEKEIEIRIIKTQKDANFGKKMAYKFLQTSSQVLLQKTSKIFKK